MNRGTRISTSLNPNAKLIHMVERQAEGGHEDARRYSTTLVPERRGFGRRRDGIESSN